MKATISLINEQRIKAVKRIHAELVDILEREKCRSCSCFYADILNGILEKVKIFRKTESNHRLVRIENDFERWIKEADFLKMHE